jgi:hypothetical protein
MFQFCPALDKHRDIRLQIEMKANFSMYFEEISMAFVKYFNYFILPVHELYLKSSGPIDRVVRFRANAVSVRTFEAFYKILSDNNVWQTMRFHELIAL